MDQHLDLIIIGYNEGDILSETFRAAKRSATRLLQAETVHTNILFVNDSRTSDNSNEIALKAGIRSCLGHPEFNTASNNRLSGFLMTSAQYVMLLDGDCLLDEDWLLRGFRFLNKNPKAGAVVGVVDVIRELPGGKIQLENVGNISIATQRFTGHTGSGSILLRRNAVKESDGLEPDLVPFEDVYLMLSLRSTGWEVWRIPEKMEIHVQKQLAESERFRDRVKAVLFGRALKAGVLFRKLIKNHQVEDFVPFIKHEVFHGLFLFASTIALLAILVFRQNLTVLIWTLMIAVIYVTWLIIQKQNIFLGIIRFFSLSLNTIGMFLGLILNVPEIKWGAHHNPQYTDLLKVVNSNEKTS